jgi:small-conductance mechanosensitive channel
MQHFLQQLDRILLANRPDDWLIALGVAVAIAIATAMVKRIAIRFLDRTAARTASQLDDALLRTIKATRVWVITVLAVCVGAQYVELPPRLDLLFDRLLTVALFLQAGMWVGALLDFWIKRARDRALVQDPGSATGLNAMRVIARFALWVVVLLMMLDNIGVNVTTMIAGLGIGGIAVALAVQNILGDLFASLSIVIDKPFVIGDFVIVGEYVGTIEYVGLKTTRLRSLGGEQIVFSNSDLLKARIRNFRRMRERRVLFSFGVLYQTSPDKVETIPSLVRTIIEANKNVRFDRAHFKGFGDSSLDFEVVYWMLDPDYNLYMNVQQTINLEMLRAFAREGVSFAYPTRTVVVDTPIKIAQAAETEKRKGDRLTAADGARPTVPTLADALRAGASKTG